MIPPLNFPVKDIVLGLFSLIIILSLLQVYRLNKRLTEEKRRRIFSLLTLEINPDQLGAYLYNDSYCYAKNIRIEDADVTTTFGYKKKLRLKFDTIDTLKPDQKAKLNYRVFDGQFDITSADSKNLVVYFENPDFEMHINYSNIENMPFSAIVRREKSHFVIKEAKPLA